MDTSLLIAKILGVYLLASGVALLFKGKTLTMVVKDFVDHRALTWLAGFVLIVLGGIMAFTNEGFGSTWVMVFGWLVLIKGIIYIVYPEFLAKIALKSVRPFAAAWGVISIVVGIWLFLL